MDDFDAVVLDIEGTTTPISFVYDVLFPFARQHVAEFLRRRRDDPAVRHDLDALAAQAKRDAEEGVDGVEVFEPEDIDAAIANVLWQMDSDRKTTALKSLQGKIWRAGYDDGTLRGVVYDDVPRALRRWGAAGKTVAIYSSGSVSAQRLLFGHSTAGDLTPFISAYFDTTTGPKREPSSYASIASALDVPPAHIVFATDVLPEAEAARDAGLHAVIMERPGNSPTGAHRFPVLPDFDAIG